MYHMVVCCTISLVTSGNEGNKNQPSDTEVETEQKKNRYNKEVYLHATLS